MWKQIIKFGWRNIRRNRRRTLFTSLAIVIGITGLVFMTSYIGGFVNGSLDQVIRSESGHIKIARREFLRLERIMPKAELLTGMPAMRAALAEVTGIEARLERIKFGVLLSRGDSNEPALALGIEPAVANRAMKLSATVVSGRYLSGAGREVIVGDQLARKLGLRVGDELLLVTSDINYSTYALPFTVCGIFASGFPNIDKHMIFMPLADAQKMLDCGDAVHEILLFLERPGAAVQAGAAIEARLARLRPAQDLAVVPWQQNDFIRDMLPYIDKAMGVIMGVVLLIVGLVILNTMLMTVMERYHEIGVLKALGFHDYDVIGMIFVEAGFIGVIGASIGGICGGAISLYLEKHGIDLVRLFGEQTFNKIDVPLPIFGKVIYPEFSAAIVAGSIVFGILLTLAAVIYPAYRAWRMRPVDAFRSQLKV